MYQRIQEAGILGNGQKGRRRNNSCFYCCPSFLFVFNVHISHDGPNRNILIKFFRRLKIYPSPSYGGMNAKLAPNLHGPKNANLRRYLNINCLSAFENNKTPIAAFLNRKTVYSNPEK